MRLTSQLSVFKRAQARWNVAKLADCPKRCWCDGYLRKKRRNCWRNLNEPLAKQPPDAAASHHHEQNRQCNCSCKHCNYCCERKDVHNAILKCEKHAFPSAAKVGLLLVVLPWNIVPACRSTDRSIRP